MKKTNLNKEERELLASVERGEWKPASDREIKRHQRYAENTLRKDRRVNIRLSSKDLEEIQAIAIEDGIPYQTLMTSILHRYASGTLVDKKKRPRPSTSRSATK